MWPTLESIAITIGAILFGWMVGNIVLYVVKVRGDHED